MAALVPTMDRPDHILIVDDDAEIRSLLTRYLEKNGLRATAVGDGRAMGQALDRGAFDLVVLDLMLPGDDGLTLCRTLRAKSDIPIVMLTARGEETDRIVGLEMGADDYLPKPFSARELLARIKVILRRTRSLPPNLQPQDEARMRFAGWVLDSARRELVSPAGTATPIGGAEYKLLRVFLAHPNRVLSREQLLDLSQGREADPLDRSTEAQISRLR
jgi:two-component system, OmpR family, response regulator